jgi:hypothetical protein
MNWGPHRWETGPKRDDCWIWRGAKTTNGYGQVWDGKRNKLAHRHALELDFGRPLGPGKFACHFCDTPACVHPSHLFEGTRSDNMLDCVAKGRLKPHNERKTHCPKGHEYDGYRARAKYPYRYCKACDLEVKRESKRRNRAA